MSGLYSYTPLFDTPSHSLSLSFLPCLPYAWVCSRCSFFLSLLRLQLRLHLRQLHGMTSAPAQAPFFDFACRNISSLFWHYSHDAAYCFPWKWQQIRSVPNARNEASASWLPALIGKLVGHLEASVMHSSQPPAPHTCIDIHYARLIMSPDYKLGHKT